MRMLRPAILLPPFYREELEDVALRAVLAHEVEHLARRDPAWTLFIRVLRALLWPQLLLLPVCERLEQITEELCDQQAIREVAVPQANAHCLVRLAERKTPTQNKQTTNTRNM